MISLGVDPGFASFGYCLFDLETERVLLLGVIRTQKAKGKVLASVDNLRRAREIHASVKSVLRGWDVAAICAESMSYPRNSSSAAKVALAWGVLACVSNDLDLPIVQASPQAIKKRLCGRQDASKEDIEQVLRHNYPSAVMPKEVPATFHEHAWDALSAVVACLDSEVIRMARRIRGGPVGNEADL